MFLVVCGNGLQAMKNGLKLRPTVRSIQSTRYQDIHTTRYKIYSNQITRLIPFRYNESAEEGDFEVVYCRTCVTISGKSIRDHD